MDFIQSVIARMASSSAVTKGWALTIAVATYGYAGTKQSIPVSILGIGAVLVFAALDSRYLLEERKYRRLFRAAAADAVEVFDMNADGYCKTLEKSARKTLTMADVMWSWSVRNYYGVIFIAGLILLSWIIWF
ncbi:hypothetical protein [Agromyces soli]|uniref:Uncharacterized protein n=1 Tax=Agromyces soli TaxID=659012 RepID=A0ABY4AU22_9MICO|nr:hypothetical protein [Agromyces soli]UOE26324.1 hypothetical protein MTP13_00670 [Agromyces soli]